MLKKLALKKLILKQKRNNFLFFVLCFIVISCNDIQKANKEVVTEWYDDSKTIKKETIMFLYEIKNDKYYLCRKYRKDGSLSTIINTKNSVMDGVLKRYSNNGSISAIVYYKDGILNGKYITFYDDTSVFFIGNYFNGVKDGEWIYYNPNHTINSIEKYRNGKIDF